MKKEYVSPLFEEVVLMTEDVLEISDLDQVGIDNFIDGYDQEEGDF